MKELNKKLLVELNTVRSAQKQDSRVEELIQNVQKMWDVKLTGNSPSERVKSLLEQLPDHLLLQEQRVKAVELEVSRQKGIVKQVKMKANEMLDQKDAEYTEILVEKDAQIDQLRKQQEIV